MKKLNFTLLACLLIVFSLILSSCGGDTKLQDTQEVSKIVVGIPQDFDSLDPHISQASGTEEVMFNVFIGLVMPSPDGELYLRWRKDGMINEESQTLLFYLRKGVLFSRMERLFTQDDVKYFILTGFRED